MRLFGILGSLVTLTSVHACAPDAGDNGDNDDEGAAIDIAEAAVTSSELSNLVLGATFNVTNSYQPNRVHAGIDFGGITRDVTQARSPVNGTIIANTAACGKVAVYDGSNTVILAHMSNRTALAEGSAVTMGTYLGTTSDVVGGGCSVTGPHLHLEIRAGRSATMSLPTNDNRNRNLDPLTYAYPAFPGVTLTAPANNVAVAAQPVTFRWNPIQGANTYRLQVSTGAGFAGENCAIVCAYNQAAGTTSRSVALPAGATYFWRVRAGNSGQGGAWSAVRSFAKL